MRIGIFVSFMTLHLTLLSQSMSGEIVNELIKRMSNVLNVEDTIRYNGQMRFKGFGQDTFEVRNFQVSYIHNENNLLYGYDFEITEVFENSDTLTYMVLDKVLNIIYNKAKQISEHKLPEVVDLASYLEYIRYSFIFNELFKPFFGTSPDNIALVDSSNQYFLKLNVNELETQELILDKNSFLPNKYVSIIKDPEFDFKQITEIIFTFDSNINKLDKSAFSTGHYLSLGYNHMVASRMIDTSQKGSQNLSTDNQNILLNYPFILANGDTSRIKDFSEKYILLEFWFVSCLPCIKALLESNKLIESYSNLGLEIIGINCLDTANKKNLEDKIRNKNVHIPLLFGARNLTETIGITSYPSYFLITPDHKINHIIGGSEEVKQILEQIFKKN